MDLEIEKNLKWLRRGPIGLYLLNYAKKLLIEEDTLRIIIAYLVAVAKPHHPAFFHKIVCLVGEKISVYL